MATKSVPSLSTIEQLLDDVEEYARAVEVLHRTLQRYKSGSPSYHDLLPELTVQLDVLKLKAEHATQALEEYEESLPESE
jgi:O-phosphoseryl-tRNA(Cys) synthetase